jgi:hypothetical protein
VFAGVDGVEADDFTGQVKSEHLFLPFMVYDVTLETTGADRSYRAELVTGTEQVFTGLYRARAVHDLLETLGFVGCETTGQAQLTQGATAAGHLGA